MTKITDAQVEVADDAYHAVASIEGRSVMAERKAMRAALEAYERVRDLDRILRPDPLGDQLRADVEQGLQEARNKVRKEYPL